MQSRGLGADVDVVLDGCNISKGFAGYLPGWGSGGSPVELIRGLANKPTGQAFVYFDDVTEAMRAKDELDKRPWAAGGPGASYRIEVLEDFKGRAIVREEDHPGDITEEKLRDKVRKSMVGKKYQEKEQQKKLIFN